MAKNIPRSILTSQVKQYVLHKTEDIAHIFQKLEEPEKMEYYSGIYAIDTSGIPKDSNFLFFTDSNVLKGFVSSDSLRTLSLIDGKNKVLASVSPSVYHFLSEDVHHILLAATGIYKDLEIIVNVSAIRGEIANLENKNMYNLFFKSLLDSGVKLKLVDFYDFDVVNIDNFFMLSQRFASMNRFNMLYDHFFRYVKEPDIAPYRKVYVSRKKMADRDPVAYKDGLGHEYVVDSSYVNRIDDEQRLESIFLNLGFEIVYPEDFKDFEEQINFFHSVKTIASLTSAGLTNMSFMQPGGNVVEVITPLTARPVGSDGSPGYLNREFHNYYKNMAASKGHFYLGIPNLYCSVDDISDIISADNNVAKVLEML